MIRHWVRALLCALSLTTAASAQDAAPATAAAKPRVKLLVIAPAADPPARVYYLTPNERKLAPVIPLGGLIQVAISHAVHQNRMEPLEATLRQTLGDYERTPALRAAIDAALAPHAGLIDVTVSTDRARYLYDDDRKVNRTARADGFAYVLVLRNEFSGLSMRDRTLPNVDGVSPAVQIDFRLHDAGKMTGTEAKGSASAFAMATKPAAEAVADREFFVNAWSSVCIVAMNQVMGELSRQDALHAMAASVGRGAEIPAIGELLKRYSRTFDWDLERAENWVDVKTASDYIAVLEPRGPLRQVLALRFTVDLLVPEFGQDVEDVREYIGIFEKRRLQNALTPMVETSEIDAPGYEKYAIPGDNGGKTLVLFRKLGPDHVLFVEVICLRDFDKVYPKYRGKLEGMIADSGVKLRHRSLRELRQERHIHVVPPRVRGIVEHGHVLTRHELRRIEPQVFAVEHV